MRHFFKQFSFLRAIIVLINLKNFYNSNKAIIHFVRKNRFKVAVDIGSSVGQFTFYFSKYCNKVYSFEPQYNPYRTSKILNYFNYNTKIYNIGIGKDNSKKKFFINKVDTRSSFFKKKNSYPTYVKVGNLNEIIKKKIDFIKIDTEGYEIIILKSIKRKVIKDKVGLYIEINKNKKNFKIIKKLFPNYIVYTDTQNSFKILKKKDKLTTNILLIHPKSSNNLMLK